MIFSSTNESGLPKWKYLLSLPIGGQFATRRVIKPEEKCFNCDDVLKNHVQFWDEERSTKEPKSYPWLCPVGSRKDHVFFPNRFSIGKTFCVQAKRTGGALCGCGKEMKEHHKIGEFESSLHLFEGDSSIKYPEGTKEKILSSLACKSEKEMESEFLISGDAKSNIFKPARFKIVGGMWHTSWAEEVGKLSIDERKEAYQKEIKLEGFSTLNGWEKYYPEHKIEIGKTWRILAERIN